MMGTNGSGGRDDRGDRGDRDRDAESAESEAADEQEQESEPEPEPETALGRTKRTVVRRRKLIGGLAVLGGLGWYGLSLFDAPGRAFPAVPTDRLNDGGWVKVDESRSTGTLGNVGPVTLRTTRNTLQYEDQGLSKSIRSQPVTVAAGGSEQTGPLKSYAPDAFTQSPAIYTASRIDFGPDVDDLPLGAGLAEILGRVTDAARDSFENALTDAGLRNVSHTGTSTFETAGGSTATVHEYTAVYPVSEFTVPAGGTTITVPASTLEVAGKIAVWESGDYIVVAGGTYPNENYTREVTAESDGQTVTLTIDLQLDPARMESELDALLRNTA